MSDSWACSKKRSFDVSLERSKEKEYGENDIIMNYTKNLMNQTLLTILKSKDWHGQGTWCVWIMIEPLKKIFNAKPDGVRRAGRPKLRWEDGVDQDMRILEVRNWKRVALNRDEWTKHLKKARSHHGLSSQWWWWWCGLCRAVYHRLSIFVL